MTTPTQLMPELLILRELASKPRCVYCHGENGTHFSNCWSPEGQAAWDISDQIGQASNEIPSLRAENERLRMIEMEYDKLYEDNTRLREACDGYLGHAAGLRAENEEWKRIDEQHRIGAEKDLHTIIGLNKEVERLREALEKIASGDWVAITPGVEDFARAALQSKGE